MPPLRSTFRTTAALSGLLALAACGGQPEASPRAPGRAEAAPVVAALTAPQAVGIAELRAGDLVRARAAFEQALGGDPDRMGALNDLALAYSMVGRSDAARQLLDEVVARGSAREQQTALLNMGELHALDGYLSAAQAYFESARGVDPARPEPLYALALLADVRGDAAATALLREALRLDEAGAGRSALVYLHPEERLHLDALVAELTGDKELAWARWRELKAGHFSALAAAAQRHLEEP